MVRISFAAYYISPEPCFMFMALLLKLEHWCHILEMQCSAVQWASRAMHFSTTPNNMFAANSHFGGKEPLQLPAGKWLPGVGWSGGHWPAFLCQDWASHGWFVLTKKRHFQSTSYVKPISLWLTLHNVWFGPCSTQRDFPCMLIQKTLRLILIIPQPGCTPRCILNLFIFLRLIKKPTWFNLLQRPSALI